jgi:hypothetical protein
VAVGTAAGVRYRARVPVTRSSRLGGRLGSPLLALLVVATAVVVGLGPTQGADRLASGTAAGALTLEGGERSLLPSPRSAGPVDADRDRAEPLLPLLGLLVLTMALVARGRGEAIPLERASARSAVVVARTARAPPTRS